MIRRSLNALKTKGPRVLAGTLVDRAWFLFYRTFGIRYIVRKVQNFQMILDFDDQGISRQLLKYEVREPDHKFILERELRPGMTVLDCGANIGYYALMMGKLVGDTGKVLAIEPSPYNFHLLNLNVFLNRLSHVVQTFHMGASDSSGEELLHLSEHSNCHTFFPTSHREGLEAPLRDSVAVPMTSVADFVEAHGRFDLLRMDTEGYEVQILDGLLPALENGAFRPKILFETHPYAYDGQHNLEKALRALFEAGYRVRYVVSNAHRERAAVFQQNCDRAIYVDVKNEDALELAHTHDVRALMLDAGQA
jgi:FkbM family methyltransferase